MKPSRRHAVVMCGYQDTGTGRASAISGSMVTGYAHAPAIPTASRAGKSATVAGNSNAATRPAAIATVTATACPTVSIVTAMATAHATATIAGQTIPTVISH